MTAYQVIRDLIVERRDREWCLFIDRDGVINRRIVGDYVRKWDCFTWLRGATSGLRQLREWAPYIVVVTNQQGVGKGLMSASDVTTIHERINLELANHGATIDDFRVCPHLEVSECFCRKPKPGLVLDWLAEHPCCEPSLSVMVGDALSDLELARNVAAEVGGCSSIHVGTDETLRHFADASFESLMEFGAEVARARKDQAS